MIKRILFIRINPGIKMKTPHPYAYRFPFILKYCEAVLRKTAEYHIKFIDCLTSPLSLTELSRVSFEWSPDLIVILSITPASQEILEYAVSVKSRTKAAIVCVGQDMSFCPERYIYPGSPVDIGVMGEAELEVCSLIKRLNEGSCISELRDLYLKRGRILIEDLDGLPFPFCSRQDVERYSYVYPIKMARRLRWGHILSSRGCPYECIFCSQTIRESYGKQVRLRSAVNVVDEMEYWISKGANIIGFDDDNFTTAKHHVLAICDEIQRRRLRINWMAHARVDNVTPRLLQRMKQSGCILLRFGVESGAQRTRIILKKSRRSDWNGRSKRIFKLCRGLGIDTAALFLIGNPEETKEEVLESIRLAGELKPDIIQVSFFTAYPGSEAYKLYNEQIKKARVSQIYHYAAPVVNLSRVDSIELQRLYKTFYGEFLFNPRFILRHLFKYARFYMHNPGVFMRLFKIKKYLMNGRHEAAGGSIKTR